MKGDELHDAYGGPERRQRSAPARDWLGHSIQFVGQMLIVVVGIMAAWITLNSTIAALSQQMGDFKAQTSQQLDDLKVQFRSFQQMQTGLAALTATTETIKAREDRTERDVADLRTTTISTDAALRDIGNKLGVMGEQIHQMTSEGGGRSHR